MLNVEFLMQYGLKKNNLLQTVEGMTIYPSDWLCPIDTNTAIFSPTDHTHTIHHFHASWLTPEEKKARLWSQRCLRKYGSEKGGKIAKIIDKLYRIKMHFRTKGVKGTILFIIKKSQRRGKNIAS